MTSITLDIKMLPPTPNQMRSAHWSRVKRVRDEAAWTVKAAINDAGWVRYRKNTPATIDIVVYAHGKAADEDNQWARCKPLIDALVTEGLLVDDSPTWLTLGRVTHQKAPPRQGHITITITYTEETER